MVRGNHYFSGKLHFCTTGSFLRCLRNVNGTTVSLVSRAHFRIPFSLNRRFGISCTFRIFVRSIIMFVSRPLVTSVARDVSISLMIKFSFTGLLRQHLAHFKESFIGLRQYFAHFKDSLSSDCCVNISRTFKVLFDWIVASVSCQLLEFSFIGQLRQYLAYFRILFHWIVALVSRVPLGFSLLDSCVSISRTFKTLFIGLLRQYLPYFLLFSYLGL